MRIIAGEYRGRTLTSPTGKNVRPSSGMLREALFNILQFQIEGARFLDLFAGSGAIGLEALSRGADHVTFVESDPQALQCIHKNIDLLGVRDRSRIIKGDVAKTLSKLSSGDALFDVIFADPPYEKEIKQPGRASSSYSEEVLRLIDVNSLLSPKGRVFIEDAKSNEALDSNAFRSSLPILRLQSCRQFGRSQLWEFAPILIQIEEASKED